MSWLISFCLVSLYLLETCSGKETLRMAHVLYRHGDRSPVSTFPTDKYQESFWPDGFGRLTQKGMRMEYELGKFLKQRYIERENFINISYLHNEVFCRSSDSERCLMSAESQMAGLYPPRGWQIWNKNISWQPVPVHTVPGNQDPLLRPWSTNCPILKILIENKKKTKEYMDKTNQNKQFLEDLEKVSGISSLTLADLFKIRDPLFVEKSHGLLMPSWLTDDKWNKLNELYWWSFRFLFSGDDKFSRISGGTLIKWIITRMDAMRNGNADTFKLNIYSAHDTTVMALLASLGVNNLPDIPYASAPIIELYENASRAFNVRMYYRNTTEHPPYPLRLPQCDYECPLDKFKSLLKNRIPSNYENECGVKTPKPTIIKKNTSLVIGLAIVAVALLIMLVASLIRQSRAIMKSRHQYSNTALVSDDERDSEANLLNA